MQPPIYNFQLGPYLSYHASFSFVSAEMRPSPNCGVALSVAVVAALSAAEMYRRLRLSVPA